jgi:PHD/YefM family antitoxin component YafN of YafNO toxin-antitoxin module
MAVNNTLVKTAHEAGAFYSHIAPAVKNRSRVVITGDDGKGESIIISIAEYDAMKEAAWERYVVKSLNEVEAVKDDPATWISLDEFWRE